jgi:N-acetyl-gamma-glutamyl-phosphate reductase
MHSLERLCIKVFEKEKKAMTQSLSTFKAPTKTTVSIVGARGYSGLELAKLLLNHPEVELTHCFATREFSLFNEINDVKARRVICLTEDQILSNLTDIVFLATPAEVSLRLVPEILKAGKKVVDLSGAYRLKKNDYQKWYGFEHRDVQNLKSAQYGLVPFSAPATGKTHLISNPGCFATAVNLALIPLLQKGLIESEGLVIDAKSGTTGAGRKAAENLLFSEVDENCQPYRIGKHQHFPEIQEAAEQFSGAKIDPHFSTHLLPVKRGISIAIYGKTKAQSLDEINAVYADAFQNYPLVQWGAEIENYARLSQVVKTPLTRISFQLVDSKLYVFSVLDNLLKGAASQAVENMNRLLDLPCDHSFPKWRVEQ